MTVTISAGGTPYPAAVEIGRSGENEYRLRFRSGATAPTVSVPTSVQWSPATPVFEANHWYELAFLPLGDQFVGIWTAVEEQDEDRAAELARKIRNKLLAASDKECVLDKILPDAPSGTSFTAWLVWPRDLAGIRSNSWGVYRRALRDLTTQAGFPFNIVWPDRPEE